MTACGLDWNNQPWGRPKVVVGRGVGVWQGDTQPLGTGLPEGGVKVLVYEGPGPWAGVLGLDKVSK